jgi:hypothetical protein
LGIRHGCPNAVINYGVITLRAHAAIGPEPVDTWFDWPISGPSKELPANTTLKSGVGHSSYYYQQSFNIFEHPTASDSNRGKGKFDAIQSKYSFIHSTFPVLTSSCHDQAIWVCNSFLCRTQWLDGPNSCACLDASSGLFCSLIAC